MSDRGLPTIAHAGRQIARKRLSPVELVVQSLDRIRAIDGRLHSFVHVLEGQALAEARQAARAIAAGRRRGPLHGIPVAIKDVISTQGIVTEAQSRLSRGNIPIEDATVVRRLRDAGAILIGKLTTHEFAIGGPSFDLPRPPARNPWNIDHYTGGSSSGAGAAVAAGLACGAVGTDTGGSIRAPAAYCGIAGLKPTYGLVGRSGIIPLAYSLDHCGPMARTAEDCALLLDAIAGYDPLDPAGIEGPGNYSRRSRTGIAGMRIGVVRHFYEEDGNASSETHRALEDAIRVLRKLGARLTTLSLPRLKEWDACSTVIAQAEAYAIHERDLVNRAMDFGKVARERLVAGSMLRAADYLRALRYRRVLCETYAKVMQKIDALVTAATLQDPDPIDRMAEWPSTRPRQRMVATPFSVTGAPALVVCAGFSKAGFPIAMQIAGKPLDDAIVLAIGRAYERATPWRERRPPL